MNNTLTLIGTFVGGGLVVFLIELFLKAGRIKVDNYSLKISYQHPPNIFHNYIIKLDLDIQFINTSGYSKIIKGLNAIFWDGKNKYELQFEGYNVPPAGVVEAKQVKCLQFVLHPYEDQVEIPIGTEPFFVEVAYNLDGKLKKLRITAANCKLIDDTRWVAI